MNALPQLNFPHSLANSLRNGSIAFDIYVAPYEVEAASYD